MLQQQPAAGRQPLRRLGDKQAQICQPRLVGHQRAARFETHVALREMLVARVDIGRVADDQVEARGGQRVEPVAQGERGVGDRQPVGITLRQRHGRLDAIDAQHLAVGPFARQRQRDGTGAGAEIENARRRGGQARQRLLYQHFCVGSRDERRVGNAQRQRPEFALADQMRHRLALHAPRQQRVEARQLFRQQFGLAERHQPAARFAGDVPQQDLRVALRAVAAL